MNRKTWHWAVCEDTDEGAVEYDENQRAHIYFSEEDAKTAAAAFVENGEKVRVDRVEVNG
jgi:hypothetical protein